MWEGSAYQEYVHAYMVGFGGCAVGSPDIVTLTICTGPAFTFLELWAFLAGDSHGGEGEAGTTFKMCLGLSWSQTSVALKLNLGGGALSNISGRGHWCRGCRRFCITYWRQCSSTIIGDIQEGVTGVGARAGAGCMGAKATWQDYSYKQKASSKYRTTK